MKIFIGIINVILGGISILTILLTGSAIIDIYYSGNYYEPEDQGMIIFWCVFSTVIFSYLMITSFIIFRNPYYKVGIWGYVSSGFVSIMGVLLLFTPYIDPVSSDLFFVGCLIIICTTFYIWNGRKNKNNTILCESFEERALESTKP